MLNSDPYAGFEDPDFDTEPTVSDTVNKLKEVVTKTEEQGKKEEDGELEIQWDAGERWMNRLVGAGGQSSWC